MNCVLLNIINLLKKSSLSLLRVGVESSDSSHGTPASNLTMLGSDDAVRAAIESLHYPIHDIIRKRLGSGYSIRHNSHNIHASCSLNSKHWEYENKNVHHQFFPPTQKNERDHSTQPQNFNIKLQVLNNIEWGSVCVATLVFSLTPLSFWPQAWNTDLGGKVIFFCSSSPQLLLLLPPRAM